MAERCSHSSDVMVKYLKDLVESNQGISLQELTGHLSQVPPELRGTYGFSDKTLVEFLRKYPKVFTIRNDTVCVATNNSQGTSSHNGSSASAIPSASNRFKEEDINCLNDATGTVYRLFPLFGFISTQYPVRTSVYFDVQSFENAYHRSLLTSGLQVGDSVIFDAKIGPKDCNAKFRASRVTRATMTSPSSPPGLSPQSANDEEMGDCGSFSHLFDQHGVVEFVKSTYGFIKFGPDERERAFFHLDNVDKSLRSAIKDLLDRFSINDKVRFNAKLSMKPSERVKWEATKVCLCQSSDRKGPADFEDLKGNGVFTSGHECYTQDQLHGKVDEYQSRDAGFNRSPTGNAIWAERSAKADSCDASVNEKENAMLLEWERRHKLFGQQGFFYPVNESVGAVRFGPGRGLVASAAVHVTYRNEKLMDNFLWDMADDQEVSFDAVRAEDNTWIATLVWIGKRPAQLRVGNGEDVSNDITNPIESALKSFSYAEPRTSTGFDPEKSGQSLGKDGQDVKNSFIFGGFETLIDQGDEEARGPSRMPSKTALPEGTSRGSLGSNSLSVAGLLAPSPAVTSTSTCMKSPEAHGQSSTREWAPGASCLSACLNKEGLRRVAKMVDSKIKPETLNLQVTLRDVGVQTVEEDLILSAFSRTGVLVPVRSSSTQTVLTGKIESSELFIN